MKEVILGLISLAKELRDYPIAAMIIVIAIVSIVVLLTGADFSIAALVLGILFACFVLWIALDSKARGHLGPKKGSVVALMFMFVGAAFYTIRGFGVGSSLVLSHSNLNGPPDGWTGAEILKLESEGSIKKIGDVAVSFNDYISRDGLDWIRINVEEPGRAARVVEFPKVAETQMETLYGTEGSTFTLTLVEFGAEDNGWAVFELDEIREGLSMAGE